VDPGQGCRKPSVSSRKPYIQRGAWVQAVIKRDENRHEYKKTRTHWTEDRHALCTRRVEDRHALCIRRVEDRHALCIRRVEDMQYACIMHT